MENTNAHATEFDVFSTIDKLDISFGNQTGILGNHDRESLCQLALDNGFDGLRQTAQPVSGWAGVFGSQGSCLKLIFGKDIPVPDGLSPGVRGDFAFQCNVTASPHVIGQALRFDMVFTCIADRS